MGEGGVARRVATVRGAVATMAAAPGEHAPRLLGFLCLAIGALVLSTMWLLTPAEVHHGQLALAGLAAILLGTPLVCLPLERVRRWSVRSGVVGVMLCMALVNHAVTGALGPYRHFYVLIFAFVGLTQPPKTSFSLLPIAVATYLVPELANDDRSLTVVGILVAAPVWVLTAELLAVATHRLKQTNLTLEARNVEVERYADFQRDFVATASHELRTPITSIAGYVELLQEDDGLNEEQRAHLGVIARNADRLEGLVADLLTLNKGEGGHLDLHVDRVPVASLVSPLVDAYAAVCARKGVGLRVGSVARLPDVYVDARQTEQVLGNLINNAVKFTPPGGTIDITAVARPRFVDVSVADTGIGIPDDELPRVFDRFFRSSTSIKMAVPGTGLGLAIAKSMVESQGARLTVTSSAGKGATFTVSLPRERM